MPATRSEVLVEESVAGRATPALLPALHAALERFWRAVDGVAGEPPQQEWRQYFATALAEIAANIVRHAHPQGTATGGLHLRLRLYADRVEAQFTDRGIPFNEPATPPVLPDLDPLALPEGGFGLAVARAAVDRVEYRRTPTGLNRWRLMKRLPT